MKRKIIPKQKYTTYASHPLVSGDVRAYEIELDLGQDVSGAEFKVVAIRADGKVIEDLGSVLNGVATYTLANSMYSVPGELTVRLQVVHNSSVLTDREIVFEVIEGTQSESKGTTVVPLNDSVILRLSAIESKLLEKVDKVSGKGLSQNDFTSEYKTKLDNLDETIGTELERVSEDVDNLSDEVDEHKNDKANPHSVTAEQVGAYTKEKTDEKLSYKADKSDITNVYKFCGSAPTFDDLPFDYALIPNGVPTKNGEVCGEYSELEGVLEHFGINTALNYGDEVIIPIKPITLKTGTYYGNINESFWGGITIESIFGYDLSVSIGDFRNMLTAYQEIEEQTVEYIKVTFPYITEEPYPFYVEHIATGLGALKKLADGWFDSYYGWRIPEGAYDNGAVYNVLDTGMNYAWNGTSYDALGGEHKDLEAREDIKNIVTQMGDIETALDSIIEIQNTLIGGGSE